ncbi:FAD-dependent oxidoreductase [Dactylosporangium sp. NPDC000244]|uniref:FAD-dependent oxidoreductase n=1 Tax=Dactylosporangium sp. NPDC000244 TaxID=3154365 RepID=UPI003329C297
MRSLSSSGDAVEVAEQAGGVEVDLGRARFTAPNAVEVEGRTLRFRKAVIATGSEPVVPPIEGLRTSTCAPATPTSMPPAVQPSRRSSRTRPMRQRGSVSRTRWMRRIARHGNSSFPTAPTPIPRWPRWA